MNGVVVACEMMKSCLHSSLWSLSIMVMTSGCVASTTSPQASHVYVCGKLYQPQTTVVTVREEPQWIAGAEYECPGSTLLSPLPPSHDGGKAGLSDVLKVATAHLRGMPQFLPATATSATSPSGTRQSAGVSPVYPVVPPVSMSAPGPTRPVTNGGVTLSTKICGAGESVLQTDVSFPRGRHEVSPAERDKLRQLQGRSLSSVRIDGLTERPGVSSSMLPLAQARAQAVQQAIHEVVPPGVVVQQGVRAGCCTKTGEPGSAGQDDLGVSVTVCLSAVPAVKKGEGVSMAK